MRSRTDVMAEKERVDTKLAEIRSELLLARANAAAKGVYMRPEDYARLELKRSDLARQSQALQRELSGMKANALDCCPTCGRKLNESRRKTVMANQSN